MKVISINVGKTTEIEWRGQKVTTSIFKKPVTGPVRVNKYNLEGDEQADLKAHGGEHRAVMVYQTASYDYWKQVLGKTEMPAGTFGENLTVEGLADIDVCIGDQYKIGTAIFEVTQPRVTCYKVGIALGIPEMPSLLVSHHRPGFYFRVIQEGEINTGDSIIKLRTGPEQVSVAEIDGLLYSKDHSADGLQRALKIPALSKGWKHSLELLYQSVSSGNTTSNPGLAPGSAASPAWQGFRRVAVKAAETESEGIRSFTLSSVDNEPLPPFTPGQHIAVRVPTASNDFPVRMYSLCGEAGTGNYRIAVKQEKDGYVSSYLHANIKADDTLEISAPRGTFTLLQEQVPLVLLGAGIGITPLWSMLLATAALQPQRPTWWIYSTQNKAHHTFMREFGQITRQLRSFCYHTVYSRPDTGDQTGTDYTLSGHLTVEMLKDMQLPADGRYYLCGPARYLSDMSAALKQLGITEEQIRIEVFGNFQLTDNKAPRAHPPVSIGGNGPLITLVKSGISFPWNDQFNNLLEALEAQEVPVNWSCRTGVCHRCETGMFSGQVSYDPQPLDPPMNGNILLCCAVPRSAIQLDA